VPRCRCGVKTEFWNSLYPHILTNWLDWYIISIGPEQKQKGGFMKSLIMAVSLLVFVMTGALANDGASDFPELKEGDNWKFRAESKDSISSSSDRLVDGLYKVVYRQGQCEAYEGEIAFGGNAAAELCRMILPDERKYLKFPLAVDNKWVGTHTQNTGRRSSTRSMEYTVTGFNEGAFQIQGDSVIMGGGGSITQKRIISYDPKKKAITNYFYDSSVDQRGVKLKIELVEFIPAE